MSRAETPNNRSSILQRWKHYLLHERGLSAHSVRAYTGDVRQFPETPPNKY